MASFDPQDFDLSSPPARPTTPPVRRGFLLILFILCLAALVVYGVPYVADRTGYAWEAGRSRAALETLEKLDKAGVIDRASALFRLATVAVSPAVVHVRTQRIVREGEAKSLLPGGMRPPLGGQGFENGLGSGVIIDKEHGYVVTNNHVVKDADQIIVRLSQGNDVSARLVGQDPKTDLAVLQIKTEVRVAAEWGDSDKLEIGEWVLAIGSPFALDHTVTVGIVSATGRNNLPIVSEESYQDFIQTDAAINPGNSGGPLIDLNGKVVGINAAIYTQSGGYEGIGFAVPSSMARRVVESLIKSGKVVRGYLGIILQPLNGQLAREFKLPSAQGALVDMVQPGSPAAKAGLKPGDVIVAIGGKAVNEPQSLRNRTAGLDVGSQVPLTFYRGGKEQTVTVTIGEFPQTLAAALPELGFRLRELQPGVSGMSISALIVSQVAEDSPAFRAGLRPGMRLIRLGNTPVNTRREYEFALQKTKPEQGVRLTVLTSEGETKSLEISIEEKGKR